MDVWALSLSIDGSSLGDGRRPDDNHPDPDASGDQLHLHFEAMSNFSVGALIGTYRIEAHIGEGGMGTVYRALDTKLNRAVAIKFLPTSWPMPTPVAGSSARRRWPRR